MIFQLMDEVSLFSYLMSNIKKQRTTSLETVEVKDFFETLINRHLISNHVKLRFIMLLCFITATMLHNIELFYTSWTKISSSNGANANFQMTSLRRYCYRSSSIVGRSDRKLARVSPCRPYRK